MYTNRACKHLSDFTHDANYRRGGNGRGGVQLAMDSRHATGPPLDWIIYRFNFEAINNIDINQGWQQKYIPSSMLI